MRGRAALDRPIDALRRLSVAARRDAARPAFLDGLVLGAMVGAAIAGSSLWSRRRASRSAARDPRPETEAKSLEDVP